MKGRLTLLSLWLVGCSALPTLETPTYKAGAPSRQSGEIDSEAKKAISSDGELSLIWPVKDGLVTQEFRQKNGRKRGHKGIDIAAPKGDGVYAAHDGLVIFAGRQFRGFGKLIIIENVRGNWATFYSHLLTIKTREGQRVQQGEMIGNIGKTGRATGYHLHFEVRHDKEPVNPLNVLP